MHYFKCFLLLNHNNPVCHIVPISGGLGKKGLWQSLNVIWLMMTMLGLNPGHLNDKSIVFVWNGAMPPWMLLAQITAKAGITFPRAQLWSLRLSLFFTFPRL